MLKRKNGKYILIVLMVLLGLAMLFVFFQYGEDEEKIPNNAINQAFERLYSSNHTFTKVINSYQDDFNGYTPMYNVSGKTREYQYIKTEAWGEYTAEPYVYHEVVSGVQPDEMEAYYYSVNGNVHSKFLQDDKWFTSSDKKEKPRFDGYGENHIILDTKETVIDGIIYIVYDSKYVLNLDDYMKSIQVSMETPLNVNVFQQYFVEKESGKIHKIITNSTEADKVRAIGLYMQIETCSYEDAKSIVDKWDKENISEINIKYVEDDFEIVVP